MKSKNLHPRECPEGYKLTSQQKLQARDKKEKPTTENTQSSKTFIQI